MPTKAELECQVKSLKVQLTNALAIEARGTPDEETAEVTELQRRNEGLCTQLSELQAQMELEKSARQEAEQALLEKQQLLVELERERSREVIQATEQLRQDLERRYKSKMDAQLELIGMLKRQVHTPTGTSDVSVGQINNDSPLSSGSRGLDMHTGGVDTASLNDVYHNTNARQSV